MNYSIDWDGPGERDGDGSTVKDAGWKPDVCIYHGNCDDGFGAAWAVWMRWGNTVRYIPAHYGMALPEGLAGQRVLIADFSWKRPQMEALANGGQTGAVPHSVVVLDHHKTAEAELAPWTLRGETGGPPDLLPLRRAMDHRLRDLAEMNRQPIVAVFDMASSGARMTWDFVHGIPHNDPPPTLISLIEDRDLWRFSFGERTRRFSAALRTYPHDFEVWSDIAEDPERLVAEGGAILRGHRRNIEEFLKQHYWTEIGGHRVPVVNVPYHYASDCADALLKAEPAAPFAAAWLRRGDGMVQWSLRSRDDRLDVSEVAKALGGGGHRNAAGFAAPA